ncbi:response regulator [candidate division KSB1 bacterium]|nr:response regulator [candidate division KSB1 bacterium]
MALIEPKKVLIVDSLPDASVGLQKNLTSSGYQVFLVHNGEEALSLAHTEQPDIILSEVRLPELDGHLLLNTIRTDKKLVQCPFIFLSSQKKVDERIESIMLGADDYITKPYYIQEVIARIEMLLAEKENRRNRDLFSGRLSEMNLVDIIQTLEVGQKSGILKLQRNGREGEIRFQAGNVIDARYLSYSPVESINKMFTWTEGVFQVQMTETTGPRKLSVTNQELILNGLHKIREWEELKVDLPPLSAVPTLHNLDTQDTLPSLSLEDRQILKFINGERTLLDIVESFQADEVITLGRLKKLFSHHLFKVKEIKKSVIHENTSDHSLYKLQIKSFLKKWHQDKDMKLSLMHIFFNMPSQLLAELNAVISGEAPKSQADKEQKQASSVNKKSKLTQKVYLTKSELMMIREKLK